MLATHFYIFIMIQCLDYNFKWWDALLVAKEAKILKGFFCGLLQERDTEVRVPTDRKLILGFFSWFSYSLNIYLKLFPLTVCGCSLPPPPLCTGKGPSVDICPCRSFGRAPSEGNLCHQMSQKSHVRWPNSLWAGSSPWAISYRHMV